MDLNSFALNASPPSPAPRHFTLSTASPFKSMTVSKQMKSFQMNKQIKTRKALHKRVPLLLPHETREVHHELRGKWSRVTRLQRGGSPTRSKRDKLHQCAGIRRLMEKEATKLPLVLCKDRVKKFFTATLHYSFENLCHRTAYERNEITVIRK